MMRKKFLSLALTLALCLSLAVPAFAVDPPEQAEGPDTFDDDIITVTNVIEQKTIDATVGTYYVKDELTCVAPVKITPVDDGQYSYFVEIDRVPAGKELADMEMGSLEKYLPESDSAEAKEPGTYYVWQGYTSETGGGFTGYLLVVQSEAELVDPPATTFSPDTVCTRGHIVTFLYRGFAEYSQNS